MRIIEDLMSEKHTNESPIDKSPEGTFENYYSCFEEVVRKLEGGDLSLEEASELFEKGIHLAKRCSELLVRTELRITRLRSEFAEQMNQVTNDENLYDKP